MKNIRFFFLSEICHFLVVKFSVYLNRRVFVMEVQIYTGKHGGAEWVLEWYKI